MIDLGEDGTGSYAENQIPPTIGNDPNTAAWAWLNNKAKHPSAAEGAVFGHQPDTKKMA